MWLKGNMLKGGDNMYTVNDVSKMLNVHINTIYAMLEDGRLKGIKIGKVWRFNEEYIQKIAKGEIVIPEKKDI